VKKPAILLLLALIVGCGAPAGRTGKEQTVRAPTTPMQRVSVGMSGEEVRELLGEPRAVEAEQKDDGTESWYYESGVVILRRGSVIFLGPMPERSRR